MGRKIPQIYTSQNSDAKIFPVATILNFCYCLLLLIYSFCLEDTCVLRVRVRAWMFDFRL